MRRLAERELGTADALAQGLAIAPVVSVGVASYAVAKYAGGATPAAMLIAFVGTIALGWVFRQFARRYAGAGTVYEYLARGGPRALGVIAAGAYFLVALLGAGGALLSSLLIENFCATRLGFDPGWWAGGVVSLALIAALLHLGVRLSTRSILGLSAAAAVPLVVLAVAVLAQGGAHGLKLTAFDPTGGDVIRALLYAVLLFGGFEAAACLGEESSRPHRSIPRAILLAICVSGLFYVVVIYAITMAFGMRSVAGAWGSDPLAVIALGDRWVGRPLSAMIELGTIVDLTAFLIAVMNVAARGYFTLARDGLLPQALGRVSRRGTPLCGIALIVLANAAMMLVSAPFHDRFEVFEATLSASPVISLGVYFLLCALSVRLLASERTPAWGYVLVIVAGIVPLLGLYGSFVPFPTGPRLAGLVIALASLGGSCGWVAWLSRRRRGQFERAAGYALVSEGHDAERQAVAA